MAKLGWDINGKVQALPNEYMAPDGGRAIAIESVTGDGLRMSTFTDTCEDLSEVGTRLFSVVQAIASFGSTDRPMHIEVVATYV